MLMYSPWNPGTATCHTYNLGIVTNAPNIVVSVNGQKTKS